MEKMKKLFALTALLATVAFGANAQVDVAGALNSAAAKVDAATAKVNDTKAQAQAKVDTAQAKFDETKADLAAQKKAQEDAAAAQKKENEKAAENLKNSLNNLQKAF